MLSKDGECLRRAALRDRMDAILVGCSRQTRLAFRRFACNALRLRAQSSKLSALVAKLSPSSSSCRSDSKLASLQTVADHFTFTSIAVGKDASDRLRGKLRLHSLFDMSQSDQLESLGLVRTQRYHDSIRI